ncbi:sulfite exporter TauE/SafE family protein [Polymorphum gilvum]|uniref:Probable membrane transporter protein n=1 Tax=Polymorphum gilvum (strain LMG 25793 / CGMCC 1.9160 / SL003B-26A1) TaxID=991905 RepID=F2J242_POLGS|nr:sulfite exporter TauE/SafE family protein [Polymorphum gilvum]ADZ68801.1 Conserved domain protein, putative [Polymorphum gilvum SL003B-26A1]
MDSLLALLLPDSLSTFTSAVLIAASFVTSAITAALGLGGGIALLAVMANVMPAAALIPVHGVVQLGSNAGRALVLLKHVHWDIMLWFTLGAVFGAAIGGSIVVTLPSAILRLGVGLFVLWSVWGRPPRFNGEAARPAMAAAGFAATLLSMFFGAAGPIGAAVLSTLGLDRHGFVANQAATALTMHVLKFAAFGVLGFAFAPWAGLIVAMVLSGFGGTVVGSRLLGRMDEKTFKKGFKLVMTLLAANLLWRAARDLLGL